MLKKGLNILALGGSLKISCCFSWCASARSKQSFRPENGGR